jgi:hypothetical protein
MAPSLEGASRQGEAVHQSRRNVTVLLPGFNTDRVHIAYTPPFAERKRPDREVIEAMTHEDARNEGRTALYALLAGAEGCGPAARSARLAQDDELADFLCRVQGEVVGEAKRLLERRVAE